MIRVHAYKQCYHTYNYKSFKKIKNDKMFSVIVTTVYVKACAVNSNDYHV